MIKLSWRNMDTKEEATRLLREAKEDLDRAVRYSGLKDWVTVIHYLIPRFGRDVTVLVYDMNGLKRIPTWQTLTLIKDACFVYDRAEIEKIFEKVLQKAEEHGIVYDNQEKVFSLKMAERVAFSLEE
jgi:hypothetical protein